MKAKYPVIVAKWMGYVPCRDAKVARTPKNSEELRPSSGLLSNLSGYVRRGISFLLVIERLIDHVITI